MLSLWEDDEALLMKVLLIYFHFFSFSPLFPLGGDVKVLPLCPFLAVSPGLWPSPPPGQGSTPALGTLQGQALALCRAVSCCPCPRAVPCCPCSRAVPCPGSSRIQVEFALITASLGARAGLALSARVQGADCGQVPPGEGNLQPTVSQGSAGAGANPVRLLRGLWSLPPA